MGYTMATAAENTSNRIGKRIFDLDLRFGIIAIFIIAIGISALSAIGDQLLGPEFHYSILVALALSMIACMVLCWNKISPNPATQDDDTIQLFPGLNQLVGEGDQSSQMKANPQVLDARRLSNVVRLDYTDMLTGLGNRQRFVDKFDKMKIASDTADGFAVGLLNLDGMKPINDLFGRAGGDEVLKQTAMRLSNAVEGRGFVTRYGGDEFGLLLPRVKSRGRSSARRKTIAGSLERAVRSGW